MTRKDYVAIAAILRRNQAPISMVEDFCEMFSADNARFDRERFIKAAFSPTMKMYPCGHCDNPLALDENEDWRCASCGSAWADTGNGPDYA